MVFVASVGRGVPKHHMSQEEVKNFITSLFPHNRKLTKLLPVFDNAMVERRQFVKDISWYKGNHDFQTTNDTYISEAKQLMLEAIDQCLALDQQTPFPVEAIDAIIFVSSSGIATPSLDAHIMNERDFREDVVRMPLWGLGCAGGASGLARGYEWLKCYPTKSVLVICCELCSLTFQKQDQSMSNLVGTAIFGDGAAATLLVGEESPYQNLVKQKIQIKKTSSFTKKNSLRIMGWNVTNTGFEVIFSKKIPSLVLNLWKNHVQTFLREENLRVQDIADIIAHPGGRKVLESIEEAIHIEGKKLQVSYNVLQQHGNMSSATVLYVLKKWMKMENKPLNENKQAILCALGPGFSSELLLLEWMT